MMTLFVKIYVRDNKFGIKHQRLEWIEKNRNEGCKQYGGVHVIKSRVAWVLDAIKLSMLSKVSRNLKKNKDESRQPEILIDPPEGPKKITKNKRKKADNLKLKKGLKKKKLE